MVFTPIVRYKLCAIILTALLCLWIPAAACSEQGQNSHGPFIEIDLNQAVYDLGPRLGVFEDPTGKLRFQDIKNATFTPHRSAGLEFGVTDSVYWLKFTVRTASSGRQQLSRERILDMGEAFAGRIAWSLYNGHTGLLMATGGATDTHGSYVKLKVTPRPQTFYLRTASTTSFLMRPRLYTWKAHLDHINFKNMWFGAFYGIIIAVAIYNLFLFFSFNDRSYLWYVLYSVFNLSYFMGINGITGRYILPDNSELLGMVNRSMLGFMTVCMALLTQSFLMTRANAPKTDRLIVALMIIAGALSLVNLFSPARFVVTLLILLGILVPLMMVIAAWNSYKNGFHPARLFMISWALFIVGVTLFALTSAGTLPFHLLGFNGFQISSGIAAVLLSLALADRIKTLRKEKYILKQAEETLKAVAQARRVFLDNSGQGFLSFGPDLVVEPEYSAECENIFSTAPKGIKITDLLYAHDTPSHTGDKQNFGGNMDLIFSEEDEFKQDLYLSLLPGEFQLGEKFVSAEYKLLSQGTLMMIFTDITQNKTLEDEILKERNRLRFVVSGIRETEAFFEILKDFKQFCHSTLPALLSDENRTGDSRTEDIPDQIYRQVHTFKGLFGQQRFIHAPRALHEIETRLSDLKTATPWDIKALAHGIADLGYDKILGKDLALIRESLGREFLDREGQISIPPAHVKALEDRALDLLAAVSGSEKDKTKQLLQAIRALRFTSVKKMMNAHLSGALELAGRQNKAVLPAEAQGEDLRVDPERYFPFLKSLVHVFRNAVDHGIEAADSRMESGKAKAGAVTCRVERSKDGDMMITIADDGQGISPGKLKDMALEKRVFTQAELAEMPEKQILELIFLQEFTTRGQVTTISGRGVGLSAVHHELTRLKGWVEIDTQEHRGTRFRFHLPA